MLIQLFYSQFVNAPVLNQSRALLLPAINYRRCRSYRP
jgi:hypothetical protein